MQDIGETGPLKRKTTFPRIENRVQANKLCFAVYNTRQVYTGLSLISEQNHISKFDYAGFQTKRNDFLKERKIRFRSFALK